MKHSLLTLALLALGAGAASAQNVGIGTTTPGSRLTVNGSFAAGYTAVATTTYTVLDNDYYVVWAGSAPGTFTLPAAAAVNKGRVYKIRNNTALFALAVNPAGGVLVDGLASLSVGAGEAVELIANGNTSGTAWEVVGLTSALTTSASAGSSAGTIGGAGGACSPAPSVVGSFVATSPTTSQTLAVTLNVATPGTYTIGTNTVNGLSFFAAGYLAATGVQTVPLYAFGTPTVSGSYAFTVAYGSSLCTTSVPVAPATFNCAGASQTLSPLGKLTNGQAYTGTYTVPYTAGSGVAYPTAAQTVSGLTLTRTAGTYAAGGGNVVYNLTGTYTGATGGTVTFTTSECGAVTFIGDAIRSALAAAGCASCAAYEAAAVDTWVPITAVEHGRVLSNISGMGAYGATAAQMGTTSTNSWSAGYTYTENFTNQTQLPASNYPVALSIRTGGTLAPLSMVGLKLKVSSTSQTAGYATIPAAASTPATATLTANTLYYFVLKKPTTLTAAAPSNLAMYTPADFQIGTVTIGGTGYYDAGDTATPATIITTFAPLVQVLSTPTKQW